MSAAISSTGATTTAASDAFASLSSGDFIKVMMSELKNQDPFQPQDSSKLLQQFSDLRNIESSMQLQQTLSNLALQDQLSSASGMMGMQVTGLDASNNTVQGLVTSVLVKDGAATLQLHDGSTLGVARVTQIAYPSAAGTPTTGA
jgi:flagellar hook assembly protein FlgD